MAKWPPPLPFSMNASANTLKRACLCPEVHGLLKRASVFLVDDVNDTALLRKLFDVAPFNHVLHLAAQANVQYAIKVILVL
ncbi:hypothetical protein Fmac_002555 [Flemingia macrophylla]|uniref:NAD(P)-binding domain-containing protein n=1 Tax=Flemingia macrophylla TaxID=520843 RepID=A0ABD1NK89_9FABA